jgi:hypothetical protein
LQAVLSRAGDDAFDQREVQRAHGAAVLLHECVERAVVEADSALVVVRLVATEAEDFLDALRPRSAAELVA